MTLHLSDEPPRLQGPLLIEMDDAAAADPATAPPVPDPEAAAPTARALALAARMAARRRSGFGQFALAVFGSLFTFVLGVSAWNFVTGLFAANGLLGWVALGLLVAALAVALILSLRELAAFARMARLDRLRQRAEAARATADLPAARAVLAELRRIYGGRDDTAWGLARLTERQAELFDADALLSLAETELFDADALLSLAETELIAPLDRAALAEVEAAARQVATVTALVPMALADVATALYANLRLIRRLSEIYGGRAGSLGSLRLMRRVFAALLGAGAIALADDLIGSFASGGIVAKLSRRFGEGVVNGALTARVGLAAMELCRPLPFEAQPKPGTSATITRALAGLFGRGDADQT